jgi:phytoene dehydrogenase-like protein
MKQENYDVLVIGSGMGGIASAALLARNGYKTLLVEKMQRLGGRWSTTEVEGFKLPTGAVCIATRGETQAVFEECGVPFDVRETASLTMWLEGKWHELPTKGQFRALLSIIEKADEDRAKVVGHLIKKMAMEKIMSGLRAGPPREKPGDKMSFRDWLLQYTDNETILQIFQALTSAISGVNDFEYPVAHWFAYTSKAMGGQGGLTYYALAPHGNVRLAEALADTVKARGGDVWTGAPATRILVEGGVAKGAIVQRGDEDIEVRSGVVICDGGPKRTVELVGREFLDDGYLHKVDAMRSVPSVELFVASDKPLTPAKGTMLVVGARRIVTCVAMSAVCPELAPPGQHLMVVWGTPANCLQHMNVEEEVAACMEDVRMVFPEFDAHGRILLRRTRDIDDEFPGYRSWHGYALNPETPIRNLYNAGDGVEPYGWEGLAACAHGAKLLVNEIKKKK